MLTSFFARLLQILIGYTPHFYFFLGLFYLFHYISFATLSKKSSSKNLKLAFPDKSKNYYKKSKNNFIIILPD